MNAPIDTHAYTGASYCMDRSSQQPKSHQIQQKAMCIHVHAYGLAGAQRLHGKREPFVPPLALGWSSFLVLAAFFHVSYQLRLVMITMNSHVTEAEWILKTISLFKERQVNCDDVRQYVLPALKAAFRRSPQSVVDRYEIIQYAHSLARMPAEFDPSRTLLGEDGRHCLGDILLTAEFTEGCSGSVFKPVRSLSA
jgi:hypothetical protein